jgi:hypothetical protein
MITLKPLGPENLAQNLAAARIKNYKLQREQLFSSGKDLDALKLSAKV